MKIVSFLFVLFVGNLLNGQVIDNFSDNNFTSSPQWSGSSNDFVINNLQQLQTNTSIASSSYLTIPHNLGNLNSKEWKFWIKMNFSPSASNFSKIYLSASNTDLTIDPDGFYLLFGETGSLDAVRLFKQQNGISTEICSASAGQIATGFAIGIRVIRDNLGNWTLFVDPSGGENFIDGFSGYDNTPIIGDFFGLICTYTVSNASKFYFDNFYIGDVLVDNEFPVLLSAIPINSNQIDLLFNENVEISSAQNIINYSLNPSVQIGSASLDNTNSALVHLSLNTPLANGTNYTISSTDIKDLNENTSGIQTTNFIFMVSEIPSSGDVIINEFMCDPIPSIGLPEVEYIEIYNRSNKYFDLQNWKIGDNSSYGTIPQKWLIPGEYVLLCSVSSLSDYLNGTGVSGFPSLNNAGDDIVLKDDNGIVVDQLSYTDTWYSDEQKKDGGYALERIKTQLPCSGETNWGASNAIIGGTPLEINSLFDSSSDAESPYITSITVVSPNGIEVHFSEGMDSTSLINSLILTNPNLTFQNVIVNSIFPTFFQIEFLETIVSSQDYSISIENVADCSQNQVNLSGLFALPEPAQKGDLVINEILYNPNTGGSDFIEIYNTSDKIIDLHNWSIANYSSGSINNEKLISEHYYLRPYDYVYLSSDTLSEINNYPFTAHKKGIQMELPSFNIDSGTVYLICNSEVMDHVSYSDDWQFSLIEDTKGKSLEKINPKEGSNSASNWHTAAESVYFATPGRINSQSSESGSYGDFVFTNATISPDNDGFEDILNICYKMTKPGMVGTFKIYNDRGDLIKTVFKNELLNPEGSFTWDGLSDSSTKAIIGAYIACFEAFDIEEGVIVSKRKAFAVAGKF